MTEITVTLQPVGRFWNGLVDDGQGFPAPSMVCEYYCSICGWRDGDGGGEGWCGHKQAVLDALRDELDSELPFDAESDKKAATLRAAIRELEQVRDK